MSRDVGEIHQASCLAAGGGERLLDEYRATRLDRPHRERDVRQRWCRDHESVQSTEDLVEPSDEGDGGEGVGDRTQSFLGGVDGHDPVDPLDGLQHAQMFRAPVAATDDADLHFDLRTFSGPSSAFAAARVPPAERC